MSRKIFGVVALLAGVAVVITGVTIYGLGRLDSTRQRLTMAGNRTASLIRINRFNWERNAATLRIITNTDKAVIDRIMTDTFASIEKGMVDEIDAYEKNIPDDAGDDLKRRPEELRKLWAALDATSKETASVASINSNPQALAMIEKECAPLRLKEEELFKTVLADVDGIGKISVPMQSIPAEIREMVLTTDTARATQIKRQIADRIREVEAAMPIVGAKAENRNDWKTLEDTWAKHKEVADRIVALAEQNSDERALELFRNKVDPAQADLTKYTVDAVGVAHRLQSDLEAEMSGLQTTVRYFTILVSVIGIVASSGLAYFVVSGIVRKLTGITDGLGEASDQVASAANSISESSQGLAEGATEQAASLEETSSALEQMASMTRQNADNATRTSDTTAQTVKRIDEGAKDVGNMTRAMSEITDSAEQISRIIKTIEEIAFQTNLLALNAAVEAARAGEAGKGFAVVADEVRNLAQRSAQAARDTASLIEGTVTRVKKGSEIATDLDSSFKEIEAGARDVGKLIGEIASATNEQAQGVDQVNTAVAQMDKVTQSNAATAEEAASAAEELSAQAETLKGAVGDLVTLVAGGRGTGRVPPPSPARPMRKGFPAGRHAPGAAPVSAKSRQLAAPAPQQVMRPDEVIPLDDENGDFGDF
ncbi:MAG: methyl-accepting chemotaxis protein [Planctomycetota bacterium]|nr:methyl-accepting chemotaxis protein [Planctomycetota bacterium]